MVDLSETSSRVQAARAVGRCYGALFFSIFGGAWVLLGVYAFARLNRLAAFAIVGVIAMLVVIGSRLQRRGKEAGKDAYPEEERRKNDRVFGIVNAVQWSLVFLVFRFFPRLGYQDFTFPAVALIVGLHFFSMPKLYRSRANLVTGASIVLWTLVCCLLFKGDRRIGVVALGTGGVLWMSAGWALSTASQLLRLAGL